MKWAKNVPAFVSLPFRDQLRLLEESWRELFVLGAAQFCIPLEASALLRAAGLASPEDGVSAEKAAALTAELRAFQDIIAKFQALQVDPTEYACLKGVVLFKTGEWAGGRRHGVVLLVWWVLGVGRGLGGGGG